MAHPFFTIGHSTRGIDEFGELLASHAVRIVVDVRRMPHSRANPQFDLRTLPESLSRQHVDYVHIPELGGLRGRPSGVDASPNTAWRNKSFRNYADYAMTEPFRVGLDRLIGIGRDARSAVMCAEALWWRCHRRIIADYLVSRGERVWHILGPHNAAAATLSANARPAGRGTLIYDVE
jgi:uncharacterized protein (DUF488 family)